MKKLLLSTAAIALLGGCASSSKYMSPELSPSQVQSVQLDKTPIPTFKRSDAENIKILTTVFNRLKPAAQPICTDAQVDCSKLAVSYNPKDIKNAYASEGYKITMFAGLMKHMTEPQIAAVLAHEMSHHIERHNEKAQKNANTGGALAGLAAQVGAHLLGLSPQAADFAGKAGNVAGQLVGVRAFSKDQERKADYLGAYILKNAGYDLEEAGKVWSTLAKLGSSPDSKEPSSIFSTHPSGPERVAAWQLTAQEIKNNPTNMPLKVKNTGPN